MRALRLRSISSISVETMDDPTPLPGEVLLRVDACGLCGTDRHIVRGEYPAILPLTPGHEFAGTVVDVAPTPSSHLLHATALLSAGGRGRTLRVGDRVAVDPNIACGVCAVCWRGDPCLCPRRVALGVDLDGGFAEYVRVPIEQAYLLPDHVPASWGALCEPLACCLHGLDLAPIRVADSVVILGGGVIGQLMVLLAHDAGVRHVVLSTRQEGRRRLAETLGATATIDPRAVDPVAAVSAVGGMVPGGADVVIECAGTIETFEQATMLARRGGTVLVFGVAPQGQTARISPFEIFARELRIVGSYLNPRTHDRAVALVASGRLNLDALITHRLTLDEVPALLTHDPAVDEVKALYCR